MNDLCDSSRSTLILIDLQERLMPAIDGGDSVLKNAHMLAEAASMLAVPVLGTVQNPSRLGPNAPAIQARCLRTIEKMDFDACAEEAFLAALDPAHELIVAGCEAHVCVLQTTLGLLQRGRRVRLVADAIGSRQAFSKTIALQRAQGAGAELMTAEMVLFEWLRSCTHPQFRDVLRLLK